MAVSQKQLIGWWSSIEPGLRSYIASFRVKDWIEPDNEDLLQELALITLMRREDIKDEMHLKNWLYKKISWMLIDEVRKRSLRRKIRRDIKNENTDAINVGEVEKIMTDILFVKDSVQILNANERSSLTMYMQGYTSKEIGVKLGIDDSSVRSCVYRGKLKILKKIGD